MRHPQSTKLSRLDSEEAPQSFLQVKNGGSYLKHLQHPLENFTREPTFPT